MSTETKPAEFELKIDTSKMSKEKAEAMLVDVTKSADIKQMIESVVSSYGRLDILVNNAGIGGGGRVGAIS